MTVTSTEFPCVVATPDDSMRVAAFSGSITVPESRRTGAGEIELAYIRLPARTSNPGAPLVVLTGGPGQSGIDSLYRNPGAFTPFTAIGDVVAFDQRGVGRSRPALTSIERLDLPGPLTRESFLESYRRAARQAARRWRAAGVDLGAYNTEESADDVEALRLALGVDRVSLLGGSYGSHLGLAVLRRHPRSIERVVLSSVEGPDDTVKLPSTVEATLRVIASRAACAEELGGRCPDLLGLMDEVFRRMDREPVAGAGGSRLSGFAARLAVAHTVGRSVVATLLPAAFLAARAGDHTLLEHLVSRVEQRWLPSAMSQVMDVASGASVERRERVRREAPGTLLGDLVDFPILEVGEAWGVEPLPDPFREPVVSSVPVLLISGDLDVRTPPGNADAVLAHLENGTHVVVTGMGHDNPAGVPELATAVLRYLAGGEVGFRSLSVPFRFGTDPA